MNPETILSRANHVERVGLGIGPWRSSAELVEVLSASDALRAALPHGSRARAAARAADAVAVALYVKRDGVRGAAWMEVALTLSHAADAAKAHAAGDSYAERIATLCAFDRYGRARRALGRASTFGEWIAGRSADYVPAGPQAARGIPVGTTGRKAAR